MVTKKRRRPSSIERILSDRCEELTRRLDDVNFIAREASRLEAEKDAALKKRIDDAERNALACRIEVANAHADTARVLAALVKVVDLAARAQEGGY